jgi:hypothetical protein
MRLGGRVGAAVGVLTGAAVLVGIWLPHFAHYYVPSVPLPAAAIEDARRTPDDETLRALEALTSGYFVGRPVLDLRDPVGPANRLLEGRVEVDGVPRTEIRLPFSPADVGRGNGGWQLSQAALTLPLLLLRAYEVTGQDRYLFAARDMIVGWAHFERHAWLPTGFLWNDHAVAARIPVLATFWRVYRGHPAYDPVVAASVLQLAARSAALLARPDHFTVATNHGVMQNLALWHYALAFPRLPRAQAYAQTALARLDGQLGFYVNDEGAILEHSAGYHRDGIELLGLALTYLHWQHVAPARAWITKYERSLAFYTALRRPDGSLPLLGDTGAGPDPLGPLTIRGGPDGSAATPSPPSSWPRPEPSTLLPVAGYAIWWHGLERWPGPAGLSQTTIAWSYFPGHGHKHADEPSVDLWAGGRQWLTNVGYWPDEGRDRAAAASWGGSNAPHLVDEPAGSQRSTRLLASGWSAGLAAVDLERRRRDGYQVRRQVIYLSPGSWVVVDHASGQPTALTRTQWTTSPDITLQPSGAPGHYVLRPHDGGPPMSLDLIFSPGATIRPVRGSLDPFAGWVVVPRTPNPADTLVVDQPAGDSWSIAVWRLGVSEPGDAVGARQPNSGGFRRDDDWDVALSAPRGPVTIIRRGATLQVTAVGDARSERLALAPMRDVGPDRERLRVAFVEAAQGYPRFRELGFYRLRVTHALLVILGLQEIGFVALAVVGPAGSLRSRLRLAVLVLWLAGGAWLALVYLR